MNPKSFLDWWPVWTQTLVWLVAFVVAWTKLVGKVNGQGGRITTVSRAVATLEGTVERHDKELFEHRRDTQDLNRGMGRLEKGITDVMEAVNQGNLQLGSQVQNLEKSVGDKDLKTQLRLRTLEVVGRIEEKIGALPTE